MLSAASTAAGNAWIEAVRNARLTGSSSTSSTRGSAGVMNSDVMVFRSDRYPSRMSAGMLRLMSMLWLAALAAGPVHARSLQARIAKVTTPVATLQGVNVRLVWPQAASQGELRLFAARVDAPDLGYRFRNLDWR